GVECNIYRDAVYAAPERLTPDIFIQSSKLAYRNNRVVYSPTSASADFALAIKVSSGFNNVIEEKNITIKTVPRNTGSGLKTILHVGDSLTEQNDVTGHLNTRIKADLASVGGADVSF